MDLTGQGVGPRHVRRSRLSGVGTDRHLRVAICAGRSSAIVRDRLLQRIRVMAEEHFDPDWIDVSAFPAGETEGDGVAVTLAAHHHLVIGAGSSRWVDVVVANTDIDVEPDELAARLISWVERWRANRRAPRRQVARLFDPDPTWGNAAARLIARLRFATAGHPVLRIDHIGSTSIDGIRAKDLIDIQVTVPTIAEARPVAEAATAAGFAHVPGPLFGKDRNGESHPEEVCVDSDPGRPVNINVRPADAPVARDALLFRDWLRANGSARDRYEAFKSEREGRQIDEYGDAKQPFISACLVEAEAWADATRWSDWDVS